MISDLQMPGGVQYHNAHTTFDEKQSIDSKVIGGEIQTYLKIQIHFQLISYLQKRN